LYGKRGQRIQFSVKGSGLDSNWATPSGLNLALRDLDSKPIKDIQVAAPKKKDWTDSISYSQRAEHRFGIRASFQVPNVPGSDTRQLKGEVTGLLVVPNWNETGFWNKETEVRVPVTLEVLSDGLAKERWWDYQGRALIAFAGSLLSLGVGLPLNIWWMRRDPRNLQARSIYDDSHPKLMKCTVNIGAGPISLAAAYVAFSAILLWPVWRFWETAFWWMGQGY
jgi:hypothetical protein